MKLNKDIKLISNVCLITLDFRLLYNVPFNTCVFSVDSFGFLFCFLAKF